MDTSNNYFTNQGVVAISKNYRVIRLVSIGIGQMYNTFMFVSRKTWAMLRLFLQIIAKKSVSSCHSYKLFQLKLRHCHSGRHLYPLLKEHKSFYNKNLKKLIYFGCKPWIISSTHDVGETPDATISRFGFRPITTDAMDVGLSDHRLLTSVFAFDPPQLELKTIVIRNWRLFDLRAFGVVSRTSSLCNQDDAGEIQ